MSNAPTTTERAGILARVLVDLSAPMAEDHAARVAFAGCMIPKAIGDHADALGFRGAGKRNGDVDTGVSIEDDRLAFAKVAVSIGFCRQTLPAIMEPQTRTASFGGMVRDAFDALLGLEPSKTPTVPEDDGETVWALFFDEQGCGPTAVSLTPEVIDFMRRPGESEPAPDDILSRTIMLSVDISPAEAGWPQVAEPGGYSMKVPAAEKLIAKVRAAIDQPREPRLDAPSTESTTT
jgi:hypothetical protein